MILEYQENLVSEVLVVALQGVEMNWYQCTCSFNNKLNLCMAGQRLYRLAGMKNGSASLTLLPLYPSCICTEYQWSK